MLKNKEKTIREEAANALIRELQYAVKKGSEYRTAANARLLEYLKEAEWWYACSPEFRQDIINVTLNGTLNSGSSSRRAPTCDEVRTSQESLQRIRSSSAWIRRFVAIAILIISWGSGSWSGAAFVGGFFFACLSYIPTAIASHLRIQKFKKKSDDFTIIAEHVQYLFSKLFDEIRATHEQWQRMSWKDLEFEVARLLRSRGHCAWVTPATGDGGIDIEAEIEGIPHLVQCKKYHKQVGPAAIRELFGVVSMRPGSKGVLVSPSGFTKNARDTARECSIELWDLQTLTEKSLPKSP